MKSLDALSQVEQYSLIKRAFEGYDEFSGIAGDIFVSDISHKAGIEVDEEGSKAAAVTEITMELTSALVSDEEIINFIVDRPFVFTIRENDTGNILFVGYVGDIS